MTIKIQNNTSQRFSVQASQSEWLICIIKTNRLVHRPSQRQQVTHHLVLVKVSMQLLEVLVLPLHGPVEVAVCQLYCIQGAYMDLEGRY